MQFAPKTQQQIDEENLCEEGEYPFTVAEAGEKTDKNGHGFFAVKVKIHARNDRDWHVFDNLSPVWMAHKLLHFCECVGLTKQYNDGNLSARDLVDRQGYCTLGVQDAQKGYPAKNIIEDYIVKDRKEAMAENKARATSPAATPADATTKEDDDVPF